MQPTLPPSHLQIASALGALSSYWTAAPRSLAGFSSRRLPPSAAGCTSQGLPFPFSLLSSLCPSLPPSVQVRALWMGLPDRAPKGSVLQGTAAGQWWAAHVLLQARVVQVSAVIMAGGACLAGGGPRGSHTHTPWLLPTWLIQLPGDPCPVPAYASTEDGRAHG